MTRIFVSIFDFFQSRKLLLFVLTGIWVLACLWIVSGIKIKEDITTAFPNDPQIKKANEILKNSSFLDRLYIVVKLKDSATDTTTNLMVVADRLNEYISASGKNYFSEFRTKVDEEASAGLIDLVYNNIPYFLDSVDYPAIDSMLSQQQIDEAIHRGYNNILSPAGSVLKKFFVKDPLGITWIGMKKMQRLNVSQNFTFKDGYIITKDGRNLMVFATPQNKTGEFAVNKEMVKSLDEAISKTEHEFTDAEIIYYGTPAMSVANANQIRHDIYFTVGLAMVVLIVLLSLYFRKWYAFPLLMLPVLFGALTAMAALTLVKGSVSSISLGIGSVMLGIILDYSLHTYTHFRENGNAREVVKDVAALLMATSGTNVLAFLCLLTLTSALLNDLGLFAAISIGSAAIFALTVFPHLMGKPVQIKKESGLLGRAASVRLDKVKFLFPLICLAIIASIYFAPLTTFNANLDKLSYIPEKLKRAEDHLDKISDFKLKKIYLVTEGKNLDEALNKNQLYIAVLDSLQNANVIEGYSSVNTCWPSQNQRALKLQTWNKFWTLQKIENTQRYILAASKKLKIKQNTFIGFFAWLNQPDLYTTEQAMEVLKPLFFSDLAQTTNEGINLINVLRVKEENKPIVYSALKKTDLAFDNKFIFNRLVQVLQNDLALLEWLSFLLVLGVVFITFKRIELALATMVPMLSAWLITLGVMGASGLTFNIFNIIICTFIFGLGIDYSIFLGRGILDHYRGKTNNLKAYKMSIILSLLVTLLSIGVMIFAHHPALKSIAAISLLGMFVTGFIAFTVQPVLFRFFLFAKGLPRKLPITVPVFFCTIIFFYLFIFYTAILMVFGIVFIRTKIIHIKIFEKLFSFGSRFIIFWGFLIKKDFRELDRSLLKKPGIIVSNHQSSLDLLLVFGLSGKIRVVTKDRIFKIPIWGSIAKMMGYYSITETSKPEFIEQAKKDMAAGYSILFFAESSRSEDFSIHRFKKGAFYLAEKTGADIIPLLIHGTGICMPKGSGLLGPGTMALKTWTRISTEDPLFPKEYSRRATAISNMMRNEFYAFRKRVEKHQVLCRGLYPRFIYRSPEVRKAYHQLLRKKNSLQRLDEIIDEKEIILMINANFGELASYLVLRSAKRKITMYENDAEKKSELQWLLQWNATLNITEDLNESFTGSTIIYNYEKTGHKLNIQQIHSSVKRIIVFSSPEEIDQDNYNGWDLIKENGFVVLVRHL